MPLNKETKTNINRKDTVVNSIIFIYLTKYIDKALLFYLS